MSAIERPESRFIRASCSTVIAIIVGACGAADGGGDSALGLYDAGPLGNSGDGVIVDAKPSFGDDSGTVAQDTGAGSSSGGQPVDADNSGDSTPQVDTQTGGADAAQASDSAASADAVAHADAGPDAGAPDCPGGLGCPCETAKDCASKVCVQVDFKKVCAPKCTPTTPAIETCDGKDNDCNGETDEGGLCGDGDPCTDNACTDGACKVTPKNCDDGVPCTKDSCEATGACANVADDKACSDNNPCTKDVCDLAAGCTSVAAGADACNDGNPCTTDTCDVAGCKHAPKACDDGNSCTDDSCLQATGGCDFSLGGNGAACDDGDKCTTGDTCNLGVCKAGSAKDCTDGSPCIQSSCEKATGECAKQAKADGTACDDGDKCTSDKGCKAGGCVTEAIKCDDGKPCTKDACDKATGCQHPPGNVGAACNDGNACTGPDKCATAGGKIGCVGAAAKKCDDGLPCTADSCDPKTGKCVVKPAKTGTACNDGSLCTLSDTCQPVGGKLVCKGKALPCDDKNPCTSNGCEAKTGACVFKPGNTGAKCDDGDKCTAGDKCGVQNGKGTCLGGKANGCDDKQPCTTDTCDPTTGKCKHAAAASGTKCDDGSKCTSGDACSGASCMGTAKSCDDGDPCTTDACNKTTGACSHGAISGCDANACNAWDVSYGNEKDTPKYSTSSEYLYDVDKALKYGGSWAAGYVNTGSPNGYQGLVLRRDDNGKLLWWRHRGGTKAEYFRGVAAMADGTAWVVGYATATSNSYLDGIAVRYTNGGTAISEKRYGSSYYDYLYDVARYGSGIVAVGHRRSSSSQRNMPWVVFMNSSGSLTGLGQRTLKLPKNEHAYIQSVAVDAKSGTVVLAGYQYISGKSNEGLLVTLSKTGAVASKLITGSNSSDTLRGVQVLGNGWIAAVGDTYPNSTKRSEGWLVRTTLSLGATYQHTYGSSGSSKYDYLYDLARIDSSTIVAAGYTNGGGSYDGWTMRLDPMTGKAKGFDTKHGGSGSDYIYAVATDANGHVLTAGRTYSASSNGDTWQLRVSSTGKTTCPVSGCDRWQDTYGNELENPKYTTSTEYLRRVVPAKKGGGSFAVGYVYAGSGSGKTQCLVVRRDAVGKRLWAKHYGGTGSDYCWGAVALADGSILTAGYSDSSGTKGLTDTWLQRIDAKGKRLWQKWHGTSRREYIYDADAWGGGIVVAGRRDRGGSAAYDVLVQWFDANGNPAGLKERVFGGTSSQYIRGVAYDPSTGYTAAVGYQSVSGKSNQSLLVTISAGGSVRSSLHGGTGSDVAYDVTRQAAGWFAAVGYTTTSSYGGNDGHLVRFNTTISSVKSWRIGSSKSEIFEGVAPRHDGMVAAVGYSYNNAENRARGWFLVVDPTSAKMLVNKKFGGANYDYLYGVAQTADKGWLLSGRSSSFSANHDTWQLSVDAKGALPTVWTRTDKISYPTSTTYDSWEYPRETVAGAKGGTLTVGYSRQPHSGSSSGNYQGFALRLDGNGARRWLKHFGTNTESDYLYGAAANPDGTFWLAGRTYTNDKGSGDGWLVRLDTAGKATHDVRMGTTSTDYLWDADTDGKGGVIAAGYRINGSKGYDAWLVRRGATGAPTGWNERVTGGSGSQYLYGVDYDPKTGNTFAAGKSYVSGKYDEGFIVRVSSSGAVLSKVVSGSKYDRFRAVRVHPLFGYVYAVGESSSTSTGSYDGFIARFTSSLSLSAVSRHGGSGSDYFRGIAITPKNNVLAVGYRTDGSSTNGWAVEMSWITTKKVGWEKTWGEPNSTQQYYSVARTSTGYTFAGKTWANSSDIDTRHRAVDLNGESGCK